MWIFQDLRILMIVSQRATCSRQGIQGMFKVWDGSKVILLIPTTNIYNHRTLALYLHVFLYIYIHNFIGIYVCMPKHPISWIGTIFPDSISWPFSNSRTPIWVSQDSTWSSRLTSTWELTRQVLHLQFKALDEVAGGVIFGGHELMLNGSDWL